MKKERNEGNEKFGTDREFGGDGTCAFSPRKSFLGKSCTCARRKCDVKLTKCNGFRGKKRSRAMKRRLDEGGGEVDRITERGKRRKMKTSRIGNCI